MENLVLIGNGGHATACIDVIRSTKLYNILGYIDKCEIPHNIYGLDYLGDDAKAFDYISTASFLIALGQLGKGTLRQELYSELKQHGAKFPSIISANAYVSDYSRIGDGTIVMHGAVIQAGVVVGENCIINDKALIEHDSRVGDNSHISTGAILNGRVSVGEGCFIGSGAVVKNNIKIASLAIVGAGALVLKDIDSNCTVVGNPAKIL